MPPSYGSAFISSCLPMKSRRSAKNSARAMTPSAPMCRAGCRASRLGGKPAEDRGTVGVEVGGRWTRLRILIGRHLHRITLHAYGTEFRVLRSDDHVAMEHLRVCHHLRDIV